MNAQIGTQYPVDSNWQDIFNEEANLPVGSEATLNKEADWPSDDSEDGDYDPEMKENCGRSSSSRSDSGGGGDNDGESSSTSVSLASDGVALSTGSWEGHGFGNMVESCEAGNEETVHGPRQRKTVDYTKLYHEMFGKDAVLQEQGSEDEDWGPSDRRKRRKESVAASTFATMCENGKKDEDVAEEIVEQSERDSVSVEGKGGRRPIFRIPRAAVEKLRQVFAENELPSKSVRDSLSKELSLDPEKVSKWFKNTRYMALRNRKAESVKQPEESKGLSGDSGPEAVMEKNTEANEIQETVEETAMERNKETNEIQETTVDETVMETNKDTNQIQVTMEETVMEKNTETNEIQGTVEETVMEEHTETNEVQETVEKTVLETNTETHEVQDTMDNETNTETNEIQETVDEGVMKKNTETNEVQDTMDNETITETNEIHETMDKSVPLKFNDPTNQTTVSPCNDDNQVDNRHANDSFPTPLEEESQQYPEQKDSSHTLVPHEELSSEMNLETTLEYKKRKEVEEFEAVMEMLCRAENKLLDVTQRLERFRTPKGRKKLGKSSSCSPEENSVVYVPTAEIKERR